MAGSGTVNPVRVVGYPQGLAISLDDAKRHLRVEHNDEDEYIASLIEAAQDYVRLHAERSLTATDYLMVLEEFPTTEEVVLAYPPVVSALIRYYPTSGAITTFTSWRLVNRSDCEAVIVLNDGASWPATATRPDAVQVLYTGGHEHLPPAAKHAIKLLVAHWYESREGASTTPARAVELSLSSLLSLVSTGRYSGAM